MLDLKPSISLEPMHKIQETRCIRLANLLQGIEKKKGVSKTVTWADGNVSTNRATVVSDTPLVSADIEKIVASSTETMTKVINSTENIQDILQNKKGRNTACNVLRKVPAPYARSEWFNPFCGNKGITKIEMLDLKPSISLAPTPEMDKPLNVGLAKLLYENKKSKPR